MSKRLEAIDKMIAGGSRDPFVWYARAMELRSQSRLEDALGAYADVEREFPEYVATYLMAAQVARELGRAEMARGFAERGLVRSRAAGDAHTASEIEAFLALLGG